MQPICRCAAVSQRSIRRCRRPRAERERPSNGGMVGPADLQAIRRTAVAIRDRRPACGDQPSGSRKHGTSEGVHGSTTRARPASSRRCPGRCVDHAYGHEPSPTADATRFTEPARVARGESGRLVSKSAAFDPSIPRSSLNVSRGIYRPSARALRVELNALDHRCAARRR